MDKNRNQFKSEAIDISSLSRTDLECFLNELGWKSFRGRQVFKWLWKPDTVDFSSMSDLPKNLKEQLKSRTYIYRLHPEKILQSVDGTVKVAWRLRDNHLIESVFIPDGKRKTICISTQVGCAVGCRFCNTARMGFIRNLTASEICLQVLDMTRWLQQNRPDTLPIRNIVFMGMGEPLLNYDNLLKSIDILTDDMGLNFSTRKITVSTCGIVPKIEKLGRDTKVKLAVSLHAPDDPTRSALMPINNKYPLKDLLNTLSRYPLNPRDRITFEYLLISGINDSVSKAQGLVRLLRPIRCKINLIAYNETPETDFKSPTTEQVLTFQKVLLDAGYTAIIRKSRGRDIDAACGQLFIAMQGKREWN